MSFSCCHHRQRGTAAVCSARPSAPHPPCPVLHGTPAHPAQERMAGQTAPQTSLSTAGSTVRGRDCNVENQKCTTVTIAPASQIDSRPAEAEESIHFLPPELRLLQPFTGKPEGKEAAEDPVPAPPEPCDRSGPTATSVLPPTTFSQTAGSLKIRSFYLMPKRRLLSDTCF